MINNESLDNIYDEYLLLVNRTHQLNRNYIPLDLEYVNVSVDPNTGEKIVLGEAEKKEVIGINSALVNIGEKSNTEDF